MGDKESEADLTYYWYASDFKLNLDILLVSKTNNNIHYIKGIKHRDSTPELTRGNFHMMIRNGNDIQRTINQGCWVEVNLQPSFTYKPSE